MNRRDRRPGSVRRRRGRSRRRGLRHGRAALRGRNDTTGLTVAPGAAAPGVRSDTTKGPRARSGAPARLTPALL